MMSRHWLALIALRVCGVSACGDGEEQRRIDDLRTAVQRDLLEALANDAEPTWLLVKEAVVPGSGRDRIEAELRALERQGLVRSTRELAFDPSRSTDSEDEWWQLTELGRGQIDDAG
jgi:hypothetical protein